MPLTNKMQRVIAGGRLVGMTSEPSTHGVEKATQTYKAGAPLIDDDAGRLTESTSPVNGSAVANRTIGFAVADATGVTGADVHVVSSFPDGMLVEATLSDATAGTHTLVQGDQWKIFPLTKDTATGNWYLDAAAVSDTGGCVVVGFKDKLGTVDARVYAKLTRSAIGGANAGSVAW